jgi:hypothetical protein
MQPVFNPEDDSGVASVAAVAALITRRYLQAELSSSSDLYDASSTSASKDSGSFSWLKSLEGYWQNPDFFFDRHGLSVKALTITVSNDSSRSSSSGASSSSSDELVAVDGFKFEPCFSAACAAGAWDGCTGNNSGIMCRQCRDADTTACTDRPGAPCNISTLFGLTFNTTFTKGNTSLCEPCATIGGADTTLVAVLTVAGVLLVVALVVGLVLRRLWWPKVKVSLKTARGSTHIRSEKGSIASKALMLLNFFQIQVCVCVCVRACVRGCCGGHSCWRLETRYYRESKCGCESE